MSYSVGQTAKLAGVSVRTLHHYEHIGLLVPSERSAADYRLYDDVDLERLTRILYYRELGFSLADIGDLLVASAENSLTALGGHLDRQRDLLQQRLKRIQIMIAALDKERLALTMGSILTAAEKLEIFGDDYDPAWEDESHERWGHSDAWQQSRQRAARRGKADWTQLKARSDEWNQRAAEAFRTGVSPDDPRSMALAEDHRTLIAEHYDCSYAMQRQLADMYIADPRFAQTYNAVAEGLAQWVHDAIHANADGHPDEQGDSF